MEYNKFEKHIGRVLASAQEPLDIQSLIDNIHGQKKNDRKFLFFIWFALGVVSICGIGYLSFSQLSAEPSSLSNPKPCAEQVVGTTSVNTQTMEVNTIESSNFNEDESTFLISENISNSKKHQTTTTNYQAISQNQKQANRLSNLDKIITPDNSDIEKSLASNTLANNVTSARSTNTNENEEYKISQLASIAAVEVNLQSIYESKIAINTDKITCPSFSNRGRMYFEVIPEIGYFMPLKTLENNNNEPNNIFGLRDIEEKTLEGLQAALYARVRKENNPFYISAGLSYARLTEKMPLQYTYSAQDTTQGVISITVSQTGDTITTIYGNIIQEKTISGSKTVHHRFALLDLPIGLGYEKRFQGGWSIGIEAGLMFNIALSAKGAVLTNDTSFIAVNTPTNGFRSSLGLGYYAGLLVGKDIGDMGRFYLSLRGRKIPSTFSDENNRIKQSYQFVGLHLGYIYSF